MIEIIAMEQTDEIKEVLQYLNDNMETIALLAKCEEYTGDAEFNKLLADVILSKVFGELDELARTCRSEGLSRFTKMLLLAISDDSHFGNPSTGYGPLHSTNFGYDAEIDAIRVTNIIPMGFSINESHDLIPMLKAKNDIEHAIRKEVPIKETYNLMLDDCLKKGIGDAYQPIPKMASMLQPPYPTFAPISMPGYGQIPLTPQYGGMIGYPTGWPAGMPTTPRYNCSTKPSKIIRKCKHVDENGKPTLYRTNPENKTQKCTQCNRPISQQQAKNMMKRYEEKLTSENRGEE